MNLFFAENLVTNIFCSITFFEEIIDYGDKSKKCILRTFKLYSPPPIFQ